MPQAHRWQGEAPRDSLMHPVWEPVVRGEPLSEPFVARCLLGAGWVGGKRRLSMLDLRVWAALCSLLRAQYLNATGEQDSDLDRASARTVETTGYQLAERVFAGDSGEHYRLLRASLWRLGGTTITVRTVEADDALAAKRLLEGYVPLIGEMWFATTRLDLRTPRQWGALKGATSLKVEIGNWTAQQIVAGRCTWLDLDLLRALGNGLAARVWVALEGWARWPQRSLDGREETAIGLGQPALESLGVGGYSQPRQARAALNRAGQRLVAVDPAYELVSCERRGGGWCLVVRRLIGGRARAVAREQGRHRNPGTAAKKQRRLAERAERLALREIVRQSLAEPSKGDVDKFAA